MENADPLDGYRGKPHLSDDEAIEAEVRAIHSLNESDLDVDLVRDVLRSDQLVAAMQKDKPLGRLVTFATMRLDECSKVWQQQADPTSNAAMNAHREARAARLLIDWIEKVLNEGAQAEKLLNEEAVSYE